MRLEEVKQLHLYSFRNILRPRGGLAQKESLSLLILEKLKSCYESWTDPKYADSKSKEEVVAQLRENLEQEVNIAFSLFLKETGTEKLLAQHCWQAGK